MKKAELEGKLQLLSSENEELKTKLKTVDDFLKAIEFEKENNVDFYANDLHDYFVCEDGKIISLSKKKIEHTLWRSVEPK